VTMKSLFELESELSKYSKSVWRDLTVSWLSLSH